MNTTITKTSGLDPQGIEKSALRKVNFNATVSGGPTTVFKADDDFVIWGPASVEVVDKEGDKIRAKALSDALPQLLKRARLSLDHSDQLVGKILEKFETDEPVEVTIGDRTYKRSEFPTGVLDVKGMEPALFVAGSVYGDSEQAQKSRKRIQRGELDSYSISGEALVTQKKIEGNDVYDDIVDMDLSAVTLCEQGMNQKSKFGVVSESTADSSVSVYDGPGTSADSNDSAEVFASVAKQATDQHMGNDFQGDSLEKLRSQFSEVLDDKLPDGEIATKSDMEQTARRVFKDEMPGDEDEEPTPPPSDEGEDVPPEVEEGHGEGDEGDVPPPPPEDEDEDMVEAAKSIAAETKYTKRQILGLVKGEDTAGEEDDMDSGQSDFAESRDNPLPDPEDATVSGEEPADTEKEEDDSDGDGGSASGDEDSSDGNPPTDPEDGEVPPNSNGDTNDESDGDTEKDDSVSLDQLQEKLPSDVFEVVREYVDDGNGGGDGMGDGVGSAEVSPDEGDGDVQIEAAVKSVLKEEGLAEKVDGVSGQNGEVESYLDKNSDSNEETDEAHGGNPALAPFY